MCQHHNSLMSTVLVDAVVEFLKVPWILFLLSSCVHSCMLNPTETAMKASHLFVSSAWLWHSLSSVAGPSTSLTTMSLLAKNTPSRSEMTKVQQQVKVNGASMTVLRREMQEIRVKQLEQQKQLQDQEQKLQEQSQVIGEQNARLAELEHKLRELVDSSAAAIGGAGPNTSVPSTSSSSAVSFTAASTSAAVLTGVGVAAASPRETEGEVGPSLKRTRKSSDLPRQSKRLRSKKWETRVLQFQLFWF